ncbi:MAG: response regulator [Cohnella sp.]|nr:response regulator [Cohnella sp.]
MMIIDDEPLVRIAFKSFLDWEKQGFHIVGECGNGKEAIDQLSRVEADVMVTDIRMPVMDGLQLIKEVRQRYPDITMLVLSSYDDFHIVKQSFNDGVYDYILKTEMHPAQLAEQFSRVKMHIEHKRIKTKHDQLVQSMVVRNKVSLKEAFFKQLIWGSGIRDKSEFEIKQLGLRVKPGNLFAAILHLDDFYWLQQKYEDNLQLLIFTILNIVDEVLNEYEAGDVFANSPEEYIIIYSFESSVGENALRTTLYTIHQRINSIMLQYLNVTVSTGISGVGNKGYIDMFGLHKEARRALEYKFVKGKGCVIFYDDVVSPAKSFDVIRSKEEFDHLQHFIERPTHEKLDEVIDRLSFSGDTVGLDGLKEIKWIYGMYAAVLFDYARKKQSGPQVMQALDDYFRSLQADGTLDELNKWLRRTMKAVCEDRSGENDLVRQAKQFIEDHYMRPIMLSNAAKLLNVSESYLSRSFSEQIGQSFMKYLMKVRIDKAKEILVTSRFRIYEVAEKVGYANTEHFSRSFKEVTGMSPKSFMRR